MQLTKEEARELIWGDLEDWEEVEREICDTSRWSILYEGIFKHDGRHYSMCWSEGATEQQDERPFEYDEPELVEVVAKPKMIVEWVPKKEHENGNS